MTLEEQSIYHALCKRPGFEPGLLDGGYPEAERKLAYFDLKKSPVVIVEIRVQGGCSTAKPGHRDYLGALMGLGIKREVLGDVLVFPEKVGAWVFTLRKIGEFIVNNLDAVGRYGVKCLIVDDLPDGAVTVGETVRLTVSSLRLDVLVAAAFRLPRNQSLEFIRTGAVFVDGAQVKKPDLPPKEGSKITLRGKGRFFFHKVLGTTGKGRLAVEIVQ